MTRLDEIRERHAARLRTRAAKGDGTVQMSTLVDDDVAWLLAEVERLQMKGIEDCRVLHGYLNDRDIELARRDKVLEDVRAAANGRVPGLKAFDPMQHPDVALRDVLRALDPQCSCGAYPHADYCPITEVTP